MKELKLLKNLPAAFLHGHKDGRFLLGNITSKRVNLCLLLSSSAYDFSGTGHLL